MGKLTEGQKLWWVPQRHRHEQQREVSVIKVGRKWAQLDNNERIDIDTLIADGGQYSPSGCCYLSREIYEQKAALDQAWGKLKRDLQYGIKPDSVTIADVEEARKLLGIADANN